MNMRGHMMYKAYYINFYTTLRYGVENDRVIIPGKQMYCNINEIKIMY
jgi:hypothetical protein